MTMLDAPTLPVRTEKMAFRILGRVVASDIPLCGLPPAHNDSRPVLEINRSGVPPQSRPEWPPFVQFEDAFGLHVHARNIGEFHISPDGARIDYALAPSADGPDVQYLLTGPVISLALQQQGAVLLHGAAIAHGHGAFGFAGPHAAGKSTLAAAFAEAGAVVLTDDVLPLRIGESAVMAQQSVPWMKLREDSLEALRRDSDELNLVWSLAEKRKVPFSRKSPEGSEFPLTCIYLLDPRDADCTTIRFVPLMHSEAALGVFSNTYAAETLRGGRAIAALDAASKIAETVPVRTISYYRSFENLPAIRDAILRDAEELARA
ncbi:MAG: hypothetical protein AB7N24_20415 [Dehalococcoidia bacterium]